MQSILGNLDVKALLHSLLSPVFKIQETEGCRGTNMSIAVD